MSAGKVCSICGLRDIVVFGARLADVFETLWANPDVVGFAIWQMNDGRTRERFGGRAVSAMFGGSVSGVFDRYRRPKLSAETVRKYFNMKQ